MSTSAHFEAIRDESLRLNRSYRVSLTRAAQQNHSCILKSPDDDDLVTNWESPVTRLHSACIRATMTYASSNHNP